MKNYYWTDGSGYLEIKMSQEQIDSICQSGSNDAAVAAADKPTLDPNIMRKVLREYGAWDAEELANDADNLSRVFWIAAWDCFDSPEFYAEQ